LKRNIWAWCLFCLLPQPALAFWAKPTVPVSVHGVNYSNEEFSYTVEDPNDAKNKAGGELINRFAAGGAMCCYELPRQWRPGLQVKVNSTHWLPKQADGKLPEVKQTLVVDVPPYADGKPGELWVLRQADGSVKVVSSDYQPDHEKWPGEVKGWPVPSAEYRQDRLRLYLKLAEGDVRLYTNALEEMQTRPGQASAQAWESGRKYNPKELVGFDGPQDPRFQEWLKADYRRLLEESESKVARYMEALK
jgi:hypothetical protein